MEHIYDAFMSIDVWDIDVKNTSFLHLLFIFFLMRIAIEEWVVLL